MLSMHRFLLQISSMRFNLEVAWLLTAVTKFWLIDRCSGQLLEFTAKDLKQRQAGLAGE